MSTIITQLKTEAIKAQSFSYSPYSQKKIGASIQLNNGQIYSGCNIENASFGATVCAERVAIWKAYSQNSAQVKIETICVVSDAATPWPPCGLCRQVIAEFCTNQTQVIIMNTAGTEKTMLFNELFPESFSPENFGK